MNNPNFGVGLGHVIEHIKAGRVAEAETICQWMLDILPQQGQVLNQQGCDLFSSNVSGAKVLFDQAVACNPDEPVFQQNLAFMLETLGHDSVAKKVRAILTVTPKTAFMPALAQAIECLKTGKTAETQAICQRMLDTLPYSGFALNQLGCEAVQAGRLDEGVLFLTQAVAHYPEMTQFHQNLAIALDAQGYPLEAQAARAALTKAPCFTVPARILNDFAAWGIASGYEIRPIPQTPFAVPHSVSTLTEGIRQLAQTMADESHKSAFAVCAENMRLLQWTGFDSKSMIPMSRNNDIYLRDSFWLRWCPFIHSLTDDGGCTIDGTPFAPTPLRIKEECFFLGGSHHFSHLLGEHLPKLHALQAAGLPDGLPIIVTHIMSDWERDTINCMGFSDRIVELKISTKFSIIEFDRVWMADGFSMKTRWDFIHSTFSRYCPPIDLVEKCALPSRVYIAREPTEHPKRTINAEEIHDYVTQRGFTIVVGEKLNTQQKIALFGQADIIIAESGSAIYNYVAFAHQNCVAVLLATPLLMEPGEILLKQEWLHMPFLDSIIFAVGHHPVDDNKNAYLNLPAIFPIDVIASAIDQAEKMANHHQEI